MTELETANLLVAWLEVLNKGYVKPDANASKAIGTSNITGVICDTKDFMPYIDKINIELAKISGIGAVDTSEVQKRRTQSYN